MTKLIHWADTTADRIIKKYGDKDFYTLASGITPSGVVHFGNFRETITVDLVARALKDRGKKVRFIFSWDDYDTFRKIPKNMPRPEMLEQYMFQPIVDTPDPHQKEDSYAAFHEKNYEGQLHRVYIDPEPIYQAKKYRNGDYKEGIRKALTHTETIAGILNKYRKDPLPQDWIPVSIYCNECNTDKMEYIKWDGVDTLEYKCTKNGHQGNLNLNETSKVKLPWRIDWPMRWEYEKVEFEPGGKDHSSEGGSFTTAKDIVADVYNWQAPLYLQYEFVSIKGAGGKMSSSSGEVITLNDVLNVYEPEMVRWIFASYRSNVEFAISFDLDVIKTYEDFDRQERLAFGVDKGNEKKVAMAKRVYQLSVKDELPSEMPFQPAFRHLCNLIQINEGDIDKTKESYKDQIKNDRDERRFRERANCALFWINNYAPEDFKFTVNKNAPTLSLKEYQKLFLNDLRSFMESGFDGVDDDKALNEKLYEIMNPYREKNTDLKPGDFFVPIYNLLISKEKGPKLAGFMKSIGKNKILNLLNQV
ncbi:MAG: lysine--tRNA ligase [Bdellovibrionales bacterium]|nr:lysine--tRNA ligase [Bdellovibrionales bacterium]